MSNVTAMDLIERLRAIHTEPGETLSDEALAGKLPITLSTLNRWKKGTTDQFDKIFSMLDEAGWINWHAVGLEDRSSSNPLARLADAVDESIANQEKGLGKLDVLLQRTAGLDFGQPDVQDAPTP